jgi:glutathione S-transferase
MELYTLSYSPWSEKARWSLDHLGCTYREREFVPLLSEVSLRRRTGVRGKLTVPLLVTEEKRALRDSFEIVKRQDREAPSGRVIPAQWADAIAAWNQSCEAILSAGRVLCIRAARSDRAAQLEGLPRQIPTVFRALLRPVVAPLGLYYLRRKYHLDAMPTAQVKAIIDERLGELSRALARGRDTIFERFTFADIAMACALQLVSPVDNRYIQLGPATRRCCTQPALAEKFGDLVHWRDRLYQTYR